MPAQEVTSGSSGVGVYEGQATKCKFASDETYSHSLFFKINQFFFLAQFSL